MKTPGWSFAAGIVVFIAFVANYFIRFAEPGDEESTGIIISLILNKGILAAIICFLVALIVIRACIWIYGFICGVRTPGVFQFWSIVAKHPDDAYEFFLDSDIWEIRKHPLPSEYEKELPSEQWAGPFDLYVPTIGERVCIFGKEPDYRKSQEEFSAEFKAR